MPWSKSRPRSRKYGHEHSKTRAQHVAALKRAGQGMCAEVVCLYRSRLITPEMDLHLCHDKTGTIVLGLGHAACNLSAAGREARARQSVIQMRL